MYIYAERQIYKASGQFKARLMFREDVTSSSRHLITSSFGSQKGYRSIVRGRYFWIRIVLGCWNGNRHMSEVCEV